MGVFVSIQVFSVGCGGVALQNCPTHGGGKLLLEPCHGLCEQCFVTQNAQPGVFSLRLSAGQRLAFFCNVPDCSASPTAMRSPLISMLPAECAAVLAVVLGDPPGVGIQFQQVSPSLACDSELLPWAVLSCEACPGVAGARPLCPG